MYIYIYKKTVLNGSIRCHPGCNLLLDYWYF
jgi:hypothetical protein